MTKDLLDSVTVVLFQPQDIVNVAGVIRVMSNFGLSDLRLVEPAAFDPYRLTGIAHHTEELVANARRFGSLPEALSDCVYVAGTTGRPRRAGHRVLTPREAAPVLLEAARTHPGQKVALLFGREQDGLPNEALEQCHAVATIPTHPQNRSLNLAQAALVLAYDLWLEAGGADGAEDSVGPAGGMPQIVGGMPQIIGGVPQVAGVIPPVAGLTTGPSAATGMPSAASLASAADREALFGSLQSLLEALYADTTESRLEASMARLRAVLMRAMPTQDEASALTNLLRHAARVTREHGNP